MVRDRAPGSLSAVFGELGGSSVDSEMRAKVVACLRRSGAESESVEPRRSEEFVSDVSDAYSGLLAARRRFPEAAAGGCGSTAPVDRYSVTWYLLWGAVSSMTAAWGLLERGYPTEPFAVARHAMEKVACAIVLFDNPSLVPKLVAGGLGSAFSARCVGPVSHVVREFGHTYAVLSRFGAQVAPEVVCLPVIPGGVGEVPSVLAVAGDARSEGPERRYWTEASDLLCTIARRILKPAAENVFFRTRRTALLEE